MNGPTTFQLVSWAARDTKTVVNVGGVQIGGDELTVIAGPCAVESREQTLTIAQHVSRLGIKLFRGGAYKPRTSPYSFQGLGELGLRILAEVRQRFGLAVVTEALDVESVERVEAHADMIQIGARNMQNFSLLRRVGRSPLPVLLKRGMAATVEELLLAAEYIMLEGNPNVVLCERGIRTFGLHARFTLDLTVVPALQQLTHLPIIVDPSHGTGDRSKVIPLARASAAVGADGLLVEVHHQPETAQCDGQQAITPEQFGRLLDEVKQIAAIVRLAQRSAPAEARS